MNEKTDTPGQQTLTIQQAIDLALEHHNAGRLTEAENVYNQILQAEPNQSVALHYLGVIALQVGKIDIAVDLIGKALAIKPDYTEAHSNLGTALKDQFKLDDAVASYRKALAINPDLAEAHNNLGVALQEQGKLDDAVASYHKALGIKPDYAEAHKNLGSALKEQGKLDDAVASYHKALGIKSDYAEAHYNLGNALKELGMLDDAFKHHRRAVTLAPKNNELWAGLGQSIKALTFTTVDEGLWQVLFSLLDRPIVRPSSIVRPVISALVHHPEFSQILKLTSNIETDSKTSYQLLAKQLSTIPLFLRLMEVTPINDLKIEQLLTSLRKSMLQEAIMGNLEEEGLPFASALALQCFTNEYAYYETDEETSSIERLQQQITELIEQTRDVQPILIATLGAYRPLHTFPWAQKLADYEWDNDISVVINRQILEPFTERSLRSQITNLTPIKDLVSQSVREQYEENPYPRWINPGLVDKGKPIGTVLRGLQFDIGNYQSPETPDILIAGCGTGQHAIETASRYKNSQVLAMDLSLSSLSYAKRKTNELNISNIEYTQADIMELGSLDRKFDLIESSGVLHHLGDPLAGWKVLVDLLRPGGLMKIGLYSEAARQSVVEGRSIIADKEYTTSPEDIRQCRQDIVALTNRGHAKLEGILNFKDFFSLSECRDLLFHVQEHRFTLPQIKTALKSLNLEFLGFEMADQSILRKFKEAYPNKSALTSLTKWHEFELKNPDTFIGMYQFWCQKK